MADGWEFEPRVEPPQIGSTGEMAVPCEETDAMVARAAKKAAAVYDRLVNMNQEDAPKDWAFRKALDDGLEALMEMVDTPARTAEACKIKLAILTQMASWYHDGHSDLLECFVNCAHEATALLQQATLETSGTFHPSPTIGVSKSVRWFAGMAAAVPSVFFGRRNSGGLS